MPKKKSFKSLMDSIELITNKLEDEQTDIETSLKLFGEGQQLIDEAKARLQKLKHDFIVISSEESAVQFKKAGK